MESNTLHDLVKRQFNKQARNFSKWSVTQNIEYQQAYFDFLKLDSDDTLLDMACGTGEFALFSAPKIKYVQGVDISEGMIDLAVRHAEANNVTNIDFTCHEVENTPFADDSFSVVICRSAFHHFYHYDRIFDEMIRCCKPGGRISVQDICAYPDDSINTYFEELEREIDISHHVTVSKEFLEKMYNRSKIVLTDTFEVEIELNFRDYLSHAKQTDKCNKRIEELLKYGLHDPEISQYYIIKNNDIYFKRNVFLIIGEK